MYTSIDEQGDYSASDRDLCGDNERSDSQRTLSDTEAAHTRNNLSVSGSDENGNCGVQFL
jgi:hypothetical protein